MATGVDDRKPLALPKRSKLYNHVWAAPSRNGWRPLYDICRTRMDTELMCLDPEGASTALLTECYRAVAQPWRNGAVLVWHPAARSGDVPVAGCVCVSADQPVQGACAFATALDALQNCLRRHATGDGFVPLRVAWVRAMLRLNKNERSDVNRGGARFQAGWAQGVVNANLEQFKGLARAPASLGGLFYPSE